MKLSIVVAFTAILSCVTAFDMVLSASEVQTEKLHPVKGERFDHQVDMIRLRSQKRREAKGLKAPKYLEAYSSGVDKTQDGIDGFLLGYAYGLQYNPYKPGKCYKALETGIDNIANLLDLAT